MRLRHLAIVAAALSLLCVYCTQTIGGGGYGAVAADGASCSHDGDCASYSCAGGTCVKPAGGLLEIDAPCSDGTCVANATCQDGICVQTCSGVGQSCGFGPTCCAGFTCGTDETCTAPGGGTGGSTGTVSPGTGGSNTCSGLGASCLDSSTCCSGICDVEDTETCVDMTCAQTGDSCSLDSDCCDQVCDTTTNSCD